MRLRLRYFSALAAAFLVVSASSPATALSISAVTISTNAGNTANFIEDTATAYQQNLSTTAIQDSGGTSPDTLAATVDARTRYAAIVVTDTASLTSRTRTATSDYKITFTVSAPGLVMYDLRIDTSRIGATTTVEDSSTSNQASAALGSVTGRLNSVVNGNLGLAAVTTSAGGSDYDPFSQAGVLTLTGLTGTQIITLDFAWTATADSTCTGFGCQTLGVDEAAVRLGMTGTGGGITGTTVDDYPGVGSRTMADDGHFVNILATVTFVPEPGTVMLLGTGLAGLGFAGTRKRS